jgi:hypothetical protein
MDAGLAQLPFQAWYRVFFLAVFPLILPFYALWGCFLNMRPVVRQDARHIGYWPLIQAVWLMKGVAVFQAAAMSHRAFRLTADDARPVAIVAEGPRPREHRVA